MNTAELVAKIADAHGVSKVQAKSIVDDIFKDIVDAAASGAEVSLPGFGKFKVKATPEREGRNPANGEKIKIAASKKLTFSTAKSGQRPPEWPSRTTRQLKLEQARVLQFERKLSFGMGSQRRSAR
jgi:DNA-binding protein HU-beta